MDWNGGNMGDNKDIKLVYGCVKQGLNGYCFVDKDGNTYWDFPQDEMAKRLAYSDELAIAEVDSSQNSNYPQVRILEIIGKKGDPIPEGLAIAKVHGLIREVPEDVREQVARIPDKINTEKELKKCRDLRHIPFITIDPLRAKDFDDAVYAEKNDDGTYLVSSPIANVARYIGSKNSPLFKHITQVGTSSYLGNIVYPMLPEELSNGICSLNEKCDRVTMCTTAKIDEYGNVLEYWIEPAVINSRHRLTYAEADYIHNGTCRQGTTAEDYKGIIAKTIDIKPSLDALFEVSAILKNNRYMRGELDINGRTACFVLNDEGTHVDCVEHEHVEESTHVIKSVAILVNELNMDALTRMGFPCLYRNHLMPSESKEEYLRERLDRFGIHLPQVITGQDLHTVIEKIKDKNIEEPATAIILKSLGNAFYSGENEGHVGLGIEQHWDTLFEDNIDEDFEIEKARDRYFQLTGKPYGFYFDNVRYYAYGHTTSPIRRGPDDINQLQMASAIYTGEPLFDEKEVGELALKFNNLERNSDLAAKKYNNMLATLWAQDHIGESFDGVIVKFTEDTVAIMTEDNIKIHIPYNLIRSVKLNPEMIELIKSKNGGPKRNKQNTSTKKKHNKNHVRPALNLGDELKGVMIYNATINPPRIFGTEDPKVFENNGCKQSYYDREL